MAVVQSEVRRDGKGSKSRTMQVLISFKCEGFKHVKMVLDLHFEQTWL